MDKFKSGIVTAMLVLSLFIGVSSASDTGTVGTVSGTTENVISATPAGGVQTGNFTKLEISPRYSSNFRLQPGESKEITVTIKNKEKKAISVKPNIVILPFGEYMLEKDWVTITPASAEIEAGGSSKFTVKVSVPKDTTTGYYSAQVAFTDEVMPVPYPQPFPSYIHAFQLSVDVWAPLKLQIMTPYLNDQLEAGKDYNYEIKLKNTANQAIDISPKLGSDNMYYGGPYGMVPPALTEESITITSPQSIPAGATETVKLHVKVPADAKGYYNGYIDLGINDPSVREWEGRVNLNFNIWKQPTEAFVRSFNMTEAAPITVEISSNNYYGYPPPNSQGANKQEPSFETSLEGPAGKAPLTITKAVIKGNVNMGGDRPPWEIDSASIYQEMGIQHIVTYRADGSPGEWKLSVMPRNTQGFEYSIIIGG